MLIMLQMSPAIDAESFLVPNAHPWWCHGLGNDVKQNLRKKSGLGQGKAAARLRAPQVSIQLAARTREEAPSSLPGQQVGLSHSELSRRPSEWLQPWLEAVNRNCPGQLTRTSSKEKNYNLSLQLCVFLWLAEVWLEHFFFTLVLHVYILVNIVPSVRFFHKQLWLGSLDSNSLFCTLVAKKRT